jgi:hypothetical protein
MVQLEETFRWFWYIWRPGVLTMFHKQEGEQIFYNLIAEVLVHVGLFSMFRLRRDGQVVAIRLRTPLGGG